VNLLLPRHCSSDEAILPALLGLRGDSDPSLPLTLLLLLKLPCERASLLLPPLSLLLRRVLSPDKLRWLLLVRRLPVVLLAPGCWNSSAMWLWPVCKDIIGSNANRRYKMHTIVAAMTQPSATVHRQGSAHTCRYDCVQQW
jgi:hypothetical protein